MITLEIANGRCRGEKCIADLGDTLTVGSSPQCTFRVEGDPELAPAHFSVAMDHRGAYVFARAPVQLDGQAVLVGSLNPNGRIYAGRTRFVVLGPGATKEGDRAWLPPSLRALGRLERIKNLFAVVDGARDERIRAVLSGSCHESLYEGDWKSQVANAGPYLVDLTGKRNILPHLLFGGWGQRWAIYVAANVEFAPLRLHLRRYLTALRPDGQPVYFRFYDPGVLSAFLPACTPPELAAFFGPIDAWIVENESSPQLLHEFRVVNKRLEKATDLLFDMEEV